MNAMANANAAQRAPEIVYVNMNDGKPVENVGTGGNAARYGKIAAMILIPLALGTAIGQAARSAKDFNEGIHGAKTIFTDEKAAKKNLASLQAALEDAGKKNFKSDKTLTSTLDSLNSKLDIKSEIVFRAKQGSLNADISGQILSFYAGVAEIHEMLVAHVVAAKADDLALDKAIKSDAAGKLAEGENANLAARGSYRYGIVINNPSEEDKTAGKGGVFGAKLVEIGQPFCGNGKMATTGSCGQADGGTTGYAYRTDPGGTWSKADLASAGPGESVPAKVLIPLLPNGTTDGLIRTGEASAAEVLYTKRLRAIAERLDALITSANSLEQRLAPYANAGDKFTFFL